MRVVITVVGKDRPGILAFVATKCAENKVNVVDVTQKVLEDLFTMIMIVEVPEGLELQEFSSQIQDLGEKEGLKIHVMHEGIFNAMHSI